MKPDALLKSTALFSTCTDKDLTTIASYSRFMRVSDGEAVFNAGDSPDRLYVIDSGEIVIRRFDDEGGSSDIARFLSGDCFGELDMFTEEKRNASAIAVGEVSLLVFPGGDSKFRDVLNSQPRVSARLLHAFLVQISAKIREVNALVKDNSPLIQELRRKVYLDKLTGLNNKTYFEETLTLLIGERKRVGLIMYKPDNFKEINDAYGHEAGDKTLWRIGEESSSIVPNRDLLFRYMGNENAVILPDADRFDLIELAKKIKNGLQNLDLSEFLDGNMVSLTFSFGLGLSPVHGEDVATLVEAVRSLPLDGRQRGGGVVLFPEEARDYG
ncbi:hypothetical protein S1OALGB6SA_1703 [Olavius algarvensis spirochete endosymbiont]|uniref:diguanylate cyclase domain-containing protein n=1 Tax=Olavius algarvensis spirochete endosymbiont TaxID=260710 RepID=UPI000F122A1D|nr:diguanylate cyclase [Olavius algarvensis spirochete endosymbiont]CAD7841736.1 MAG: hypothetical protein [Olavius algarvensis spirochete endosymbiont]VDB00620.1 hypothetical protein S1OALGB6SA_1703 [Olavius algarvensis spirochete endosymbiont]